MPKTIHRKQVNIVKVQACENNHCHTNRCFVVLPSSFSVYHALYFILSTTKNAALNAKNHKVISVEEHKFSTNTCLIFLIHVIALKSHLYLMIRHLQYSIIYSINTLIQLIIRKFYFQINYTNAM